MTLEIDIMDAQHRFLELIQAVEHGDAVILTRARQPIMQLVLLTRPQFGSAHGLITIADDFDAPLDDFREYMP